MCGGVVNPKLGKSSEVLPCTMVRNNSFMVEMLKKVSNLDGKK